MSEFRVRLIECIPEKMNVSEFARNVGVSEGTIRAMLNNDSLPRMGTLIAMATVAGVTVEWLATGRGFKTYAEMECCVNRQDDNTDKTDKTQESCGFEAGRTGKRMVITTRTVVDWE